MSTCLHFVVHEVTYLVLLLSILPPNTRRLVHHAEDSIIMFKQDVNHCNLDSSFVGFSAYMFTAIGGRKGNGPQILSMFESLASFWRPAMIPLQREFMGEDHAG